MHASVLHDDMMIAIYEVMPLPRSKNFLLGTVTLTITYYYGYTTLCW